MAGLVQVDKYLTKIRNFLIFVKANLSLLSSGMILEYSVTGLQ